MNFYPCTHRSKNKAELTSSNKLHIYEKSSVTSCHNIMMTEIAQFYFMHIPCQHKRGILLDYINNREAITFTYSK